MKLPATDIEFAMQAEIDALRADRDKLKEEVERLRERIRFADQDCAAECAGLRGENAKLVERVSELEKALRAIEAASGDQPAAMNMPAADWYRSRFYDCVATASAALSRASEGK
jgi:uncharacterized membrane protein YccC